jgi:threonine/homoserine/homoserine lactone efflux protein
MADIQNYGSFVMAIIVFQLIPGAGTITILNAAARRGIGGGLQAVGGTLTGDLIYMLAAVLGLAAILGAYPGLLAGAQWLGAAYLCWLGWKHLRTPATDPPVATTPQASSWAVYRQALAVSLTNPKVIMFFMAFFPLFLSPASTPLTLVVLMAHVTAISLLYQTLLVLAGNAVARRLAQWPPARVWATRLAGVALIGFGVKLACNNR